MSDIREASACCQLYGCGASRDSHFRTRTLWIAQRSAIALFRWPQLGLGTLCHRESGLLRRSPHFGGNWKLTCF